MEPGQYTGKTDATQGSSPRVDRGAQQAAGQNASGGGEGGRVERSGEAGRGRRESARIAIWVILAIAICAGIVLYFRYERSVVPLFGGGH
jgi:hypothetical protein